MTKAAVTKKYDTIIRKQTEEYMKWKKAKDAKYSWVCTKPRDPANTWRIHLVEPCFEKNKIADRIAYVQAIVKALSDKGWTHTKINCQNHIVFKKTFDKKLDFKKECEQKDKINKIIKEVAVPNGIYQIELENFKLIMNDLGFKHYNFSSRFYGYCPSCSVEDNKWCEEKGCTNGNRNRGQIKLSRQKGMPYPKIDVHAEILEKRL